MTEKNKKERAERVRGREGEERGTYTVPVNR